MALVLGDDEIEWIIEEVDADLGCSRIGEFCVEVTCLARNVGERPNTSGVRAHLAPADGGAGFTDVTRLRLDPGEERIVSFSFEEVQLGLEEYTHRCTEVAER